MKTAETKKLISQMRNKEIKEKKERLEYIGRWAPYGYIKENKSLLIDKNTSHIVYLIYNLYDKGFSYTQIADYLNERGITSPSYYRVCGKHIQPITNDENKKWQRGAIRKILCNKVYNGSYQYTNKKTHIAIIHDSLFNRVQLRTKEKKNYSGVDIYYHNGNIFSNKVYCEECGRVLTISPSHSKGIIVNYLRCSSCDTRGKNKVECINKSGIKYEELKDIVSLFFEQEIYYNIDFNKLENMYEKKIKDDEIEIHRKYLKQEKNIIKKEIGLLSDIAIDEVDLISKLKNKYNKELFDLYNNRLNELELLLKEIYSFARTKNVTKKECFIDKYLIETFIDKITIGKIVGHNRNINIVLK